VLLPPPIPARVSTSIENGSAGSGVVIGSSDTVGSSVPRLPTPTSGAPSLMVTGGAPSFTLTAGVPSGMAAPLSPSLATASGAARSPDSVGTNIALGSSTAGADESPDAAWHASAAAAATLHQRTGSSDPGAMVEQSTGCADAQQAQRGRARPSLES
jgi:hypothetical protein